LVHAGGVDPQDDGRAAAGTHRHRGLFVGRQVHVGTAAPVGTRARPVPAYGRHAPTWADVERLVEGSLGLDRIR
jgi:hypothetical protein